MPTPYPAGSNPYNGQLYPPVGNNSPTVPGEQLAWDALQAEVDALQAQAAETALRGPFSGVGSPEGVVSASVGAQYLDTQSGILWIKQSGDGTNTGWQPFGGG